MHLTLHTLGNRQNRKFVRTLLENTEVGVLVSCTCTYAWSYMHLLPSLHPNHGGINGIQVCHLASTCLAADQLLN